MAPTQPADQAVDPAGAVTRRRLVLIGGGEHAGVVADAAATDPDRWDVVGFTDPDVGAKLATGPTGSGLRHLGDDRAGLAGFEEQALDDRPDLVLAVGGVGDPAARRRVTQTVEDVASWTRWAVVVHRAAWVSPSAELADGTVVLAGAVINAGARVGAHGIVNTRAVVEHDVRIGSYVHVGPGAVIGGAARIGSDVTIGLGALIRDHIAVGDGAVIGMGAVVVADVPAGATVMGSPARPRVAASRPAGRT